MLSLMQVTEPAGSPVGCFVTNMRCLPGQHVSCFGHTSRGVNVPGEENEGRLYLTENGCFEAGVKEAVCVKRREKPTLNREVASDFTCSTVTKQP